MARRKNRKTVAKIDEIVNSVPNIKEIPATNDGTMDIKAKIVPIKNQKAKPFPWIFLLLKR